MNFISLPGRERSGNEPSESRRSKLDQIIEQLHARNDVYYAGEIVRPNFDEGWIEAVDIIVAPTRPIYDPRKLNEFMDGLIKGIKTSSRDEARHYDSKSDFHLGRLYFDEDLGVSTTEATTHIVAYEPEALERAGITPGDFQKKSEEKLERRTFVRVYPDVSLAQIVADYQTSLQQGTVEPNNTFGDLQYWITPAQLRALKERRNPFARISGLLGDK